MYFIFWTHCCVEGGGIKMEKSEIDAFIEEMKEIGDKWESEDVERVYSNTSLEVALRSRKSELGLYFDIISKVLNR